MIAKIVIDNKTREYNCKLTIEGFHYKISLEVPIIDYETFVSMGHIEYIHTYINFHEKITLIANNLINSIHTSLNDKTIILSYKSSFVLTDWHIPSRLKIKSFKIHFREIDSIYIEEPYKFDVTKKSVYINSYATKLYENSSLKISVSQCHNFNRTVYKDLIIRSPYMLIYDFKKEIDIDKMFEYIRQTENCFGFIIGHKLSLIGISILDSKSKKIEMFLPYMKNLQKCKEITPSITSLDDNLIQKILPKYFNDEHIKVVIDVFYEYIYNELNSVLKFTSLVNCIELLLNNSVFKSQTNKLNLKEKVEFIFYNKMKLTPTEKFNKFITKIKDTRTFYVHGEIKNIKFDYNEITLVNQILKSCIYLLILESCGLEIYNSNFLIVINNKEIIEEGLKVFIN